MRKAQKIGLNKVKYNSESQKEEKERKRLAKKMVTDLFAEDWTPYPYTYIRRVCINYYPEHVLQKRYAKFHPNGGPKERRASFGEGTLKSLFS